MLSFTKFNEDYEAIKNFNLIGKDRPKTIQDMANAFRIMKSQGYIRQIGSGYFSIAYSGWNGGPYILKYHNVTNNEKNSAQNFDGYIEWAKYVIKNQDNNPHLPKIFAFQPLYDSEEMNKTMGYYAISERLDIANDENSVEKYIPKGYFFESMQKYSPKINWKSGEEPFDLFDSIIEYTPEFNSHNIADYIIAAIMEQNKPIKEQEFGSVYLIFRQFIYSIFQVISTTESYTPYLNSSYIREGIKNYISDLENDLKELLNLYNHDIQYKNNDPDDITNVGPVPRITKEGFLEFIFTKAKLHKPQIIKDINMIAVATGMLIMSESLTSNKFFEAVEFIRKVNMGEHDLRISSDLHSGNFGFRPSDQQFVIVDPFSFISWDGYQAIPGERSLNFKSHAKHDIYDIKDVDKFLSNRFPEEQ